MYNSPYKGMVDVVVKVGRKEGLKAFYRSYTTQLSMNIPYQCTHLLTYDFLQTKLNRKREYNPLSHCISGATAGALAAALTTPLDVCKTLINTQECCNAEEICKKTGLATSAASSLNSSSAGSSTSSSSQSSSTFKATNKTIVSSNLNTIISNTGFVRSQSTSTTALTASGLKDAVRIIYLAEGFRGFFKGILPRTIFQIPGTAVSWSVYEYFKHSLNTNNNLDN